MNVVFVVENHRIGFSVSGGRYHSLLVACGFRALGHSVSYVTQNVPPFFQEFSRYYEMPAMILTTDPMRAVKDVRGADLVITYPIDWTAPGLELAKAIGAPHWAFVLDAWPVISKWAPAIAKRMHYSDEHTKALRDSDLLLTISEYAVEPTKEWTGNPNVKCLMGCVNSRCADSVSVQTEKRGFVAITRNTEHKRIDDLLYVAKKINNVKLGILTSFRADEMRKKVAQAGLSHLVRVHSSLSEEDKFRLIKGAIAGIGASAYEGLGMPFMEYLYCGLPVACYEFPILEEVCGDGALYANHSSPESLVNQAEKLLDDYTRLDVEIAVREVGGKYSFESMCERLKELFDEK